MASIRRVGSGYKSVPIAAPSPGVPCAPSSPAPRERFWPILLSAPLLLWPALLNGYPIVFDDTGTYLSQAVHRYLGWDRPVFYSLFLFPLHMTITTWPAVVAQALLAAYTLDLARRILLPAISLWWLLPFVGLLAVTTALPWFASQLMPDIFTPLLILTLAVLLFTPERLSRLERIGLVLFAAFMIATQQSSVVLSLALLVALTPLRRWLGAETPLGRAGLARLAAPPMLAMTALIAVNLAGYGRLALAPFGNVFLLARVIYDGPGMDVLRRDCPGAGWRLCPFLDRFPPTSDQFLWLPDSPIVLAGGHKRVSADADAIILAALRAEPRTEVHAWLRNGITQLGSFATGDEMRAFPSTVTPWIDRDFPAFEQAAYAAARQTGNRLAVPDWMQALHAAVALGGIAGCGIVLVVALRRRHVAAGFAGAVLLAVLANAFIAGGLSTPHHRYGSRVMLLGPVVALLGGVALARKGPSRNDRPDRRRSAAMLVPTSPIPTIPVSATPVSATSGPTSTIFTRCGQVRNRPGTIESAGHCGRTVIARHHVQPVIASAAKQSPAFRAPARHAGDCFATLAMTGGTLFDAVIPGWTLSRGLRAHRGGSAGTPAQA